MDDTLSASAAGTLASRARKLLRLGRITHRQFALLDTLLWGCRTPGRATACVSYSQLQDRAHQARSTVAEGLRVLEQLGLVQRIKSRVLAIGANGGRVWKQLTSAYRLLVGGSAREFDGRTDIKPQESTHVVEALPSAAVRAAQEALRRIAEAREAQRAADWQSRRAHKEVSKG